MKPRYSGKLSRPFWDVVNRHHGTEHALLYMLGCALQEVEGRMLQALEIANACSKSTNKRKPKRVKCSTGRTASAVR